MRCQVIERLLYLADFHASFIMSMQVVQEREPLSQSWSNTEVASDTSKTGDYILKIGNF